MCYEWAHRGAHAYEHHVNYDDSRRWHDLGSYGAGRPRGDAAAGALSTGAIKIESKRGLLSHAAASTLSVCVTKLKGTHHSISNVALTRSRSAPTRSRARAARSATWPPTRARPMAHNLSGDTGTNYARRAKSTERRAAARATAGAH